MSLIETINDELREAIGQLSDELTQVSETNPASASELVIQQRKLKLLNELIKEFSSVLVTTKPPMPQAPMPPAPMSHPFTGE